MNREASDFERGLEDTETLFIPKRSNKPHCTARGGFVYSRHREDPGGSCTQRQPALEQATSLLWLGESVLLGRGSEYLQ